MADIFNSLGEAELESGKFDASLRDYSESVRLFTKLKPDSVELADAMDGLSGILWKLGRYSESERYHLDGVVLVTRFWVQMHP